jgi:hypothetical protein
MGFVVRPYEDRDERGWLICRLLSFFDTAFFDAVEREKERYAHPDHQRRGIASSLLAEAEALARERGIVRLEAWTRDDAPTQRWYERRGFVQVDSYLHVYLERDDLRPFDGELHLVKAFAHYTGERRDEIRERYSRVHDDVLYEKRL